jgi:hypothetical protein
MQTQSLACISRTPKLHKSTFAQTNNLLVLFPRRIFELSRGLICTCVATVYWTSRKCRHSRGVMWKNLILGPCSSLRDTGFGDPALRPLPTPCTQGSTRRGSDCSQYNNAGKNTSGENGMTEKIASLHDDLWIFIAIRWRQSLE